MCKKFVEEFKNLSDEDIICHLSFGNYSEIQILINRYMPLILKNVSKYDGCGIDAEDLIQEGVIAVFSAVKAYDSTKSKFSTFVSHCVSRAIFSQVKKTVAAKRIPPSLISSLDSTEIDTIDIYDPESIYISKENYRRFKDNICSTLSELEYKVFSAFVSGDSYAKIADDLSISIKSVDNSLRRIREKLRK